MPIGAALAKIFKKTGAVLGDFHPSVRKRVTTYAEFNAQMDAGFKRYVDITGEAESILEEGSPHEIITGAEIAPYRGQKILGSAARYIFPNISIHADKVHTAARDTMNRMAEFSLALTKNRMGVPTDITVEGSARQQQASFHYQAKRTMIELFDEYKTRKSKARSPGQGETWRDKESIHPQLRFIGNRAKDYFGKNPDELNWTQFTEEISLHLRKNTPLSDITDREIMKSVQDSKKHMHEMRKKAEEVGYFKKIEDFTDDEIFNRMIAEGHKIPDDDVGRKGILDKWRVEENGRREAYWPVMYDIDSFFEKSHEIHSRLFKPLMVKANVKFQDVDTWAINQMGKKVEGARFDWRRAQEDFSKAKDDKSKAAAKASTAGKEREYLAEKGKMDATIKRIEGENQRQFKARLAEQEELLHNHVEDFISTVRKSPFGRLDGPDPLSSTAMFSGKHDPSQPRPRFFKERKMEEHYDILYDYMIKDPLDVRLRYDRTTIPAIEMKAANIDMKEVGRAMQKQNRLAGDKIEANKKLSAKEKETAQKALQKRFNRTSEDLLAIYNRVLNADFLGSSPSLAGARIGASALKLSNLLHLNTIVLASIPDAGRPIMEFGFAPTIKTLFAISRNLRPFFEQARKNAELAGVGTDIWTGIRLMQLTEISPGFKSSRLEKSIGWLASPQGMLTLMNAWNAGWKQFSGIIASDVIISAGETIAKGGKLSDTLATQLNKMNLSSDRLVRIYNQWTEHSNQIFDGTHLAQSHKWADKQAQDWFEFGIYRWSEQTIVTPTAGIKPKIMSHMTGKILLQYRSYSLASTQMVLMSGLQGADAQHLNGALMMLFFGELAYLSKAVAGGWEVSDNPRDHLLEAIDRSGVISLFTDANNFMERASDGRIGISPLIGGTGLSPFEQRNYTGNFLGPVANVLTTAGKTIAGGARLATGEAMNKEQINATFRMVPYSGLFYAKWLTNHMRSGAYDMFGIE